MAASNRSSVGGTGVGGRVDRTAPASRSRGVLVTGAMLVMLTLEGIGVAADQWFGSRADPTSPAASMAMVPAFAALAVVIGTVLALYMHNVDRPRPGGDAS